MFLISVGKSLITRGPGGTLLDITLNYKYPEGSKEERASFRRASKGLMYAENREDYDEEETEEVELGTNESVSTTTITPKPKANLAPVDLMVRKMLDAKLLFELVSESKQQLGKPMVVRYRLINAIDLNREVFVNLAVHSIHYNGQSAFKVMNVAEPVELKPLESNRLIFLLLLFFFIN